MKAWLAASRWLQTREARKGEKARQTTADLIIRLFRISGPQKTRTHGELLAYHPTPTPTVPYPPLIGGSRCPDPEQAARASRAVNRTVRMGRM